MPHPKILKRRSSDCGGGNGLSREAEARIQRVGRFRIGLGRLFATRLRSAVVRPRRRGAKAHGDDTVGLGS
jgi:hypothetical protein